MSETIAVGLSGGVDSALTAALLQSQGYKTFGIFMKNWDEDDAEQCVAAEDLKYAQDVCDKLKIPLYTVNFSSEYWDSVFNTFLDEYRTGRTPNPDVLCNREIKFKHFLDYAISLGADKIATGHYAAIERDKRKLCHLLKPKDKNKDQTYFLHQLNQEMLSSSLFPLAQLKKEEVRSLAKKYDFNCAQRKDSTGICFIGKRNFRNFLAHYLPIKTGEIIDENGKVLGEHQGVYFYTIGQREGLGIGGIQGNASQAWYVAEKKLSENQLLVVQGHNHSALFKSTILLKHIHWITIEPEVKSELNAKIRYRQEEQVCQLETVNAHWKINFQQKQWAVTPGQSIVFYRDNECLGGGIIEEGLNIA